jgi:hypothetical protein
MNHLEVLVKTILLLLLEKKYNNNIESIVIAKKVLKVIEDKRIKQNNGDTVLNTLKNTLSDIIDLGVTDVDSYISSLEVSLSDKATLIDIIHKQIGIPLDNKSHTFRKSELLTYIKKENSGLILNKYFMLSKNPTVNLKRLSKVMEELEEVFDYVPLENESVMNSVDFFSDDDIDLNVDEVTEMFSDVSTLKTGWKCLNEMLAGGIRRGEMMSVAALPHNYKSGMVKSLLLQLARLNKPVLDDDAKKPLILFLSLEEELKVVLLFLYLYFKFRYDGISIDPTKDKIDNKEMKEYLKKYMRPENGYHIKILRLHPSKTTIHTVTNIVEKLEKSGYEIHVLLIDYLSQMSREGCDTGGPSGSDYKDLFKRVRTLLSNKKIACITPHQISPAGKAIIRAGIPAVEFVKHLPGKGYYAHSSQLDQELDVELFIHKAFINKKPVLTIQRGKLRTNLIVDEDKLYAVLDFPFKAPIPEDTEEKSYCRENLSELDDFSF